jgi:dTDP-4-dehydrorhamnose reductase
MLGSSLVSVFCNFKDYEIYGLGRSYSNAILKEKQYIYSFENFNSEDLKGEVFDIIIHTAALTDIHLCEKEKSLANKINIDASIEIAKLALNCNAKLIYISTDSIFDGISGNYSEFDIPAPLNHYAYTKYIGELKVQEICKENSLIVRTNIYGLNCPSRNTIAEWAIKEWTNNRQINGFDDVYFNALYTEQLADILIEIIEFNIDYKILNIGSSEFISKYEFLNKLRSRLGYGNNLLLKSSSSELIGFKNRPKNTTLNLTRLKSVLNIPTFDDGIDKLIKKLNFE